MNNKDYWAERAKLQEERVHQKGSNFLANLKKEYNAGSRELQEQLKGWYSKYADENGMTVAQAKKVLSPKELRRHQQTLDDLILAAGIEDEAYKKALRNRYLKSRVSRLQSLQEQVRLQLELLGKSQEVKTFEHLQEIYRDTYYRGQYHLGKAGLLGRFDVLDPKAVEQICLTPWSGKSFSQRIWGNHKKLIKEVQRILSTGNICGSSIETMSMRLAKRMEVSYSRAECLIRTESAFIREQAAYDTYVRAGTAAYDYLATLDSRTSKICASLDGRTFAVKEKQVGINYPPMHPRCRSTTVPHFDDEFTVGEMRAARTIEGDGIKVPAAMNYTQWYKRYIKNKAGYKVEKDTGMKLTKKAIQAYIASEVSRLPAAHQQWLQENLEMVYVSAAENSGYLGNGVIRLHEALVGEPGVLVHEMGHMLEKKLGLLNNQKYLTIMEDVFGDFSFSMIKIDSTHYIESILLYFNPRVDNKFVSEYQRRIYMEEGLFNENGVNYNCFKDYIAEGYAFYISEPDVLKAKDANLFAFIEGLI